MKKTLFCLLTMLLMALGASAQNGSLYLHMSQNGAFTSYNLADISKVHFGGNTMDIVTAGGTDSYAYSPLNTAKVSSDPDPQVDYTNGFGTDGSYEPATTDASGYYEIDNGGKLFWLAEQVNNGTGTAYNAKLTADIDLENRLWTPMGIDATNAHTGVFDGQGHNITGLNIVAEASTAYAAFIGNHTGTSNITNFHISGTVTVKGTANTNYAAGVVANANGSHKIQDIWCSVNIVNANTSAVSCRLAGIVTRALSCTVNRCIYDGTIDGKATSLQVAGIIGWVDNNNVSLTNCLFNGTLSSTGTANGSAYMGGLLGYTSRTINCANNLSVGTLDSPTGATRTGAIVGQSTYATPSVFANNYVLEGLPVAGSATAAANVPTVTAVNDAQLANGTITAALGNNWIQGAATPCPHDPNAQPAGHTHTFVNGFCTDATCTAPYQEPTKDSENYYLIDNGGKLFWFAQQVNDGTGSAYNLKLTADIDLENRLWTPMGSYSHQFYGAIDGQGHSITNLNVESADQYVGFIGVHNYNSSLNTDIVNFKLYGKVKYTGTGETSDWVAGVVAWDYGEHKMQDVWCYVNIETPNASSTAAYPRIGGIVGQVSKSKNTFNRCVYAGTITAANAAYVGGLVAYPASSVAIVASNCLYVGTIKSTRSDAYVGGVVSYSNTTASSWTNNLSIGSFEVVSSTRTGVFGGYANKKSYNNNYVYLGNGLSKVAGSGTPDVPDGVTGVAITEVTSAELTDGTLPARLSAMNWTQGTNNPEPGDYSAITDEDLTVDGIKYIITSDNTVAVTYPNTDQPSSSNPCTYSGSITIPATVTIKGTTFNVTAIGDYAFHYAPVTSLTLPEGIVSLGYKAIYQTQLTEITVPNSVTTMDYEALGYNKQLVTINFGENIAANTWGDKLCIYGGKKYEVYMNCDAVPTLRSYTFDFTGANVHVRPTMYAAFKADAAWSTYDIIGDLWIEYTYDDLQTVLANYAAPTGDAVGTDPGCYTNASVQALSDALAAGQALTESATLEQLNNAINNIIIAYDALETHELQEGYYYIESLYKPGYAMTFNTGAADTEGITTAAFNAAQDKFYFKLTRHGGNWYVQDVANGMYMGTAVGGNSSGKYLSITDTPEYEQVITWVAGGAFKMQNIYSGTSATYPYRYYNYRVNIYNYADSEKRIHWRFHPAEPGKYPLDFNLENGRVRGFVHDFEYADGDASQISNYKKNPPARLDQPVPATVFWTRNATSTAQQLAWSTDATFADATTVSVDNDEASYEIYNLIPGKTYYYKVTATVGGAETELLSSSFTTSGQVRMIKADGVSNIRDLGGWPTESGYSISYGRIFRGAAFTSATITPEGIEAVRAAGVRAELDLRDGSQDGSMSASLLGSDVEYNRIKLAQTASHMTGLTGSKAQYIQCVQYVLDCVKENKPVYFHCAIGRDRTGTLAFLLEGVLGMSKSDIYKDYELTNFSSLNTPCSKTQLDEMFTMVEALEGTTLEDKFRTYLTTEFGISADDIDAFRTKMLNLPQEVTISEMGYSTYVSDKALVIPEGVTAYGVTGLDGTEVELTQLSGTVLAANVPVILAGEAGTTYYLSATDDAGSSIAGNLLVGTGTEGKTVGENEAYILYNNQGTAVFRIAGVMTLPAHKAYLPAAVVGGAGAKEYTLGDLTGINNAQAPNLESQTYFDLQGRKVAAPQKGQLYIVNGKKVLY
ncbi:MAG: tyrosine-protein phosphatase [Bacteroidaceae bacterium]|nr:tyrosine-protein phosphatase [Bacteroidaceae bacterium]